MNDERDADDWQHAMLEAALEERFGERPPDLAAAVLERTRGAAAPHADAEPLRARGGRWFATAAALLGVGVVLAVRAFGPDPRGADPAAPAATPQDRDLRLLPLDPGAEWTYRVRRDGAEREVTMRVLSRLPAPVVCAGAPATAHDLVVHDGDSSGFTTFAANEHGLFRLGTARTETPMWLDPDAIPTELLPLPAGVETRWSTKASEWRRNQIAGRGGGGAAAGAGGWRSKRIELEVQGELVAPSVEVEVPAGKYRAAHVRLTMGTGDDRMVEELWLAAGTGIVRRTIAFGGAEAEVDELTRFVPGRAEPDPKATLAAFLRRDAALTELGPVKDVAWMDAGPKSPHLRSALAVVTFAERRLAFRVFGGKVTAFETADSDQWGTLVRDEKLETWNEYLLPQARCMVLGELAVRTRAAMLDLHSATGTNPNWQYRAGPGGGELHYSLPCTTAAGEAKTLVFELSIGNDGSIGKAAFVE
jgi:hypothetical protein